MTTTPEYDAILARKMAERHAELLKTDTHYQANVDTQMHKVTTMTEAETQAEILHIQDGAKSSFEGEITMESIIKPAEDSLKHFIGEPSSLPMVTKKVIEYTMIIPAKKKKGWPKGKKRGPRKPKVAM